MNDSEKLAIYILSGITFLSGMIALILGCILTPTIRDNNTEEENENDLGNRDITSTETPNDNISRNITIIESENDIQDSIEILRHHNQTTIFLEHFSEDPVKNKDEEIMMTFSPSYFMDFRPLEEESETDF